MNYYFTFLIEHYHYKIITRQVFKNTFSTATSTTAYDTLNFCVWEHEITAGGNRVSTYEHGRVIHHICDWAIYFFITPSVFSNFYLM
jgi:hypothetical protein